MKTLLDQHPAAQYIRQKLNDCYLEDGIPAIFSDKEFVEIDNLCAVAKNLWNNLFFENGSLYAKVIVDLYYASFKASIDYKKKKRLDDLNKAKEKARAEAEEKEKQLKEATEVFVKRKIEELEKQRIEIEKGHKYRLPACNCYLCRERIREMGWSF